MTLFRRSSQTAWRRVQDEVLIVATQGNRLSVLNDTAARVWELLDHDASSAEIARTLSQEFEVDEETARADAERLLTELLERNLVSKIEP